MKKFASIFLSLMLVLSMVLTGVMSVSAYTTSGKTGTLTLVKQEPDNTPDVKTDNKPVAGAEFTIYPILELDSNGLYQKTEPFKNVVEIDELMTSTVNKDGYLTYGDSDKLEKQIYALQVFAASNRAAIASSQKMVTNAKGLAVYRDLPYGVYLVVETVVPDSYTAASKTFLASINAQSVDSNGNVTAYPKNVEMADVDKNIIKEDGSVAKSDVVSIGDVVNYEITAQVPVYDTALLNEFIQNEPQRYSLIPFFFFDTHDEGLTFNGINTVKVMVGRTDLTRSSNIAYNANARKLSVDIPFDTLYNTAGTNLMGQLVSITYSATLNEKATITEGESNTVDFYYVNDPAVYDPDIYFSYVPDGDNPDPERTPDPLPPSPDGPTPFKPAKDPIVYTYQLNLSKLLNKKAYNANAGDVTFTLSYSETENGTYEDVSFKNLNGIYYVSNATATATNKVLSVDNSGNLVVRGLKAGVYKLTETKTASGYTMLTAPVSIFVNEHTNDVASGSTNSGVDGEVDAYRYNINSEKVDIDGNDGDGIFELTVNNSKNQFNMPATGGMGMLIFTIVGAVILAVAIILIVSSRKKTNE